MRNAAILLFLVLAVAACSKSSDSPPGVTGTWAFTGQNGQSFAWPSALTNPQPIAVSSWQTTLDSIRVEFDNSGHYTFTHFPSPVDQGTFYTVQDSLLIISPNSSVLLQFCYGGFGFYTLGGGSNSDTIPNPNISYSDTLLFKRTSANALSIKSIWFTKAAQPLIPSMDTVILNASVYSLKRL